MFGESLGGLSFLLCGLRDRGHFVPPTRRFQGVVNNDPFNNWHGNWFPFACKDVEEESPFEALLLLLPSKEWKTPSGGGGGIVAARRSECGFW